MKIIHLISGGDVGGAKTHVLSLLRGMTKENEILLVCFSEGDFSRDARGLGIPTRVMPSKNIFRVCADLTRLIQREKYDVVHCHGSRANLICALIRKRVKAPVVTTVHSDPKLDYLGRPLADLIYGSSNRWAIRRIRYRQGVSGPTCRMLISRGFSAEHTFEIGNGVDFEHVEASLSREEFLSPFGFSGDDDLVIFGIAARITPVKDMKTLIRGFAGATRQVPFIRLVIAGEGEERDSVEALAKQLGVEKYVAFAGWLQDTDSFYHAIDVNMLTSLSEGGFPYAISEGARMGCATIATAVGGIPQVLRHEENGLLIQPGDAEALASAMVRLARDREFRERLGEALREKVRRDYSLEATCRRQVEIYHHILQMEERRERPRDGVLICGAYGNGNAGDDTILQSIVQQLRLRDPLIPVCVMSKRPAETALQTGAETVYSFDFRNTLRKMRRVNLFISGGGSLIQDVTSTRSLIFYLFGIWAAHRRGCRVMMYGCGIGPVKHGLNRRLAGRIIDRCVDSATLRDPDSMAELGSLGVTRTKVRVTADPALLQEGNDPRVNEFLEKCGIREDERCCLFALRPWNLSSRQLSAFAAAADYAYRAYGLKPVFFTLEPRKDGAITEIVAGMVRVPHLVLPPLEDGSTICSLMHRMNLVVSMRLHALIFACGQGVPVVGVAYDPKVSSFLDYMGLENCLSTGEITDGSLCDLIDGALSGQAAADAVVERMRALAQQNGEVAWSLLTGGDDF